MGAVVCGLQLGGLFLKGLVGRIVRFAGGAVLGKIVEILLPEHVPLVDELFKIVPAVDAGVVAVGERELDRIVADHLHARNVDEALANLKHGFIRRMALHFGGRRQHAQVFEAQTDGAVFVNEFEFAALLVKSNINGYFHLPSSPPVLLTGRICRFGYQMVDEDKKADQVREVFDSVAPKYDLLNDVLSLGLHRVWKSRCINATETKQGQKVLDIASGTCDLAIALARRAGAGNVVATDINHEMLAIGAQRLLQAGFPCPVVEADAEMLPFADNTFDVVTVSFGIRNMTHKDRALREMLRVLRPGGRLLVLEFSKCQPWFKPIYDFYSFRFMPWAGGVIAGDRESYRYLAESIRMHPDQPTFAGMMTDAGFERVSWKNMTFGICAMHIGFKPGA